MKNLYHRLLLLIAGSTQKQLASQIRYLKIENQILRSTLPYRVEVTARERNRLVKFGSKLGQALGELVTIVHPDTLRRWIREERKNGKHKPAERGRPRTKEEIRQLILRLVRENEWGYTRILGELRKLGVKAVSRNTVKANLRENGLDPGPQRGAGIWDEFLKIHAATLWQCDFFSKNVLTVKGLRDLFVLVFLHVESRRVFICRSRYNPNEAWVKDQAQAFLRHVNETGLEAKIVMHDRDSNFTASFDESPKSADLEVKKAAFRSPNTVAFVERFIQTLRQEFLKFFIVFGRQHMDYLIAEATAYYNHRRSHMERDWLPPLRDVPEEVETLTMDQIEVKSYVGGLVKSFERKAA